MSSPGPDPAPRRARAVPGWAVVLAVVAVVLVTTAVFVAGTVHEGSPSADEAVDELVAALEAGDVAAVLAVLPPGERDGLDGPLLEILEGLQGAGVLGGRAGSGELAGVEVDVEDLQVEIVELDRQVSFAELVGGTVRIRIGADAVPDDAVRARLRDERGLGLDAGIEIERDLAVDPVVVGLVDEGGGWFVSLGYTLAEWWRRDAGAPLPDVETRPDAIGSTTPAEVVSDLLGAVEARFPLRVAELILPAEGRSAYDYATLWLPPLEEAARRAERDEAAGRATWTFTVDALVTHVEGDGGERRVVVDELDATVVDGYEGVATQVVIRSDGCTAVTTSRWVRGDAGSDGGPADEVRRVCPGTGWTDAEDRPVAAPAAAGPLDLLVLDGLGGAQPAVTVVERGGRWFLSPTRSVLDSLVEGLDAAGPDGAGDWFVDVVGLGQRLAAAPPPEAAMTVPTTVPED